MSVSMKQRFRDILTCLQIKRWVFWFEIFSSDLTVFGFSAGIEFTIVNISSYKAELKKMTGKTSAPSVWIKGTYVGGCNDGIEPWHGVKPMIASGKFQEMAKL